MAPSLLKYAFPPNVRPDARLLVLGSLPGDRSIAQAQYYAHPSNAFWWLIGEVLAEPLAALDYEARLARLRARHIALWDVIAHAERPGSLDGGIRFPTARDLGAFVDHLPELSAVAFNGATAARHGRRQLARHQRLALIDLPSSSAAFAGMTREAKSARWLELRRYLDP